MKIGFLFLCKKNKITLWLDFLKIIMINLINIHSYDQENITQDFVKKYHMIKY